MPARRETGDREAVSRGSRQETGIAVRRPSGGMVSANARLVPTLILNSNYAETGVVLESAAGTGLLLAAAYRDVVTRIIPNTIPVLLAACGLVSRAMAGSPAVIQSIAASISLFLLLLIAHSKGVLGGGDVKLMAAVACGLSLPELSRFILFTGVAGGVLAGIHLWLRGVLKDYRPVKPPSRGSAGFYRVLAAERWRIARRGPLPYGVAIACGGIAALGPRLSW